MASAQLKQDFDRRVELAELEPTTSWVRFTRGASPPFATVRRLSQLSGFRRNPLAAVRRASPPLLDQNLTMAEPRPWVSSPFLAYSRLVPAARLLATRDGFRFARRQHSRALRHTVAP